jgi:hypothetical protein
MREDNLLSLRAKPFVPRTTMSRRGFAIRPNLARFMFIAMATNWRSQLLRATPL